MPDEHGAPPATQRIPIDLLLLPIAFFFLFAGAGAQQTYLLAYLEEVAGWEPVKRAWVLAAVYLSFSFFRVANVYLLRSLADHLSILLGALTYLLFIFCVLLAPTSYPLLVIAAVVWGWGAAAVWSGSSTRMLDVTDTRERYGAASSFLYGGTHAGFLVGVVLLGMLRTRFGGFTVCWVAVNITAVAVLVLTRLPRRDIPRETPSLRALAGMALSAKGATVGFFLLTSSLGFGLLIAALDEYVGGRHSARLVPFVLASFPAARLVVSFAGGILSDRFGRHRVFLAGFGLTAAGLIGCVIYEHPASVALAALFMGGLHAGIPVAAMALIGDSADRGRRPLAYGALFVWRDLGIVVAILASRILQVHTGGFETVLLSFGVLFALCCIPAALLGRRAEERL
ncbi:MAG: MFS transporter [Armatimonadota bacterium]|jgi:MFS family permease